MEKFGHIPFIEKGVVFSDPVYGPETWCQYRKSFTDSNWYLKLVTKPDPELGYIDFQLMLGRPTMMAMTTVNEESNESFSISHPSHYKTEEKEIGMDTAQIFCGSMTNWEQFAESAALHTGSDGLFGSLIVFNPKGDNAPAGFLLMGGIDDTFASEQSLFRHLLSGFDGREISREVYEEKTDMSLLANKTLLANEFRAARQSHPRDPGKDTPER